MLKTIHPGQVLFRRTAFIKAVSSLLFLMSAPTLIDLYLIFHYYRLLGIYLIFVIFSSVAFCGWLIVIWLYCRRRKAVNTIYNSGSVYRFVGSFLPFAMLILPGVTLSALGLILLFPPISQLSGWIHCRILGVSPRQIYSDVRINS